MGKTVIAYYSRHKGNTKKVLDALKEHDPDLVLIDVTEKREADLTGYDRIGFASGSYYTRFAEQILNFARINLPVQKDVFFICTAGNPMDIYFNAISEITRAKHCKELGRYLAKGLDTFGPFKLVGGIQKEHPNSDEIAAAVEFYKNLFDEKI